MRKNQNILVVLFFMMFLPVWVMGAECTTYTDISNSSYKSDILYASDKGWITCKDGAFNPSTKVSRREAIKMALLAGGHNPPDTTAECFDDIAGESWSRKYICYAKAQGIIASNASFEPSREVNFGEASKMILNSMTSDDYGNSTTSFQKYLDKMALYGFNDSSNALVNKDYFVHILREIEKEPNKQAVIAPTISSVTPTTATLNESTTFTVNGTNLPTTLTLFIPDCENMTALNSSSTNKLFSCTPSSTAGIKSGLVKDKSGGTTLKTFTVDVKDTATSSISILNVSTNPTTVKKGESITFSATLDNTIGNGYSAYLKFTDTTIGEKLMSCNGKECSYSKNMEGVGLNRPFRINLRKDGSVSSYKDGSYSVEENINTSTCEAYGSYEAIDKAVTKKNEPVGSLWQETNEEYGYNQPYEQIYLDEDPNLPDYHSGVDISVTNKTPLYALADGEVVKIKDSIGAVYIRLDGQKGTLIYMHLSSFNVKKGDKVYVSDSSGNPTQIGTSGAKGASGRYHLHLAWLKDESDNPVEIWSGNWNNDITSVTYDPKNLKKCGDTNQPTDTINNGKLYGIDVSSNNSNIVWKDVKAKGISFAFIRSSQGFADPEPCNPTPKSTWCQSEANDSKFIYNMDSAIVNNIPVAPYHVIYPSINNTIDKMQKSAKYFASRIKNYYKDTNNKLFAPIIDIENNQSKFVTKELLDAFVKTLRTELNRPSLKPLIYTNDATYKDLESIGLDNYTLWIARYRCNKKNFDSGSCTRENIPYQAPSQYSKYKFWQFSETSDDIITGKSTDKNIFYGTFNDLESLLVNGKSNYKVGNIQKTPSQVTAKIQPIVNSINNIKQSITNFFNSNYFGIYSFNPSILTAQNEQQTLDIYGNGFTVDTKVLWDDGEGSHGIIPQENTQNILPTHIQIKLTTLSTGVGTWTFKVQNGDILSEAKDIQVRYNSTTTVDEATAYRNHIGVQTIVPNKYDNMKGGVKGAGWFQGECTSYVGYKLRTNGLPKFSNVYKGAHFGDAKLWAGAASKIGWVLSDTPKAGAIGYWKRGLHGHVVYIDNVNTDGTVNISEYNVHLKHKFHQSTNVIASTYKYIYPPYPTATNRMARTIDATYTEEDMKIGLLLLELDRLTLLINELNYEILNIQDQNIATQLSNELEKAYGMVKTIEDLIFNNTTTLEEIQNDIIDKLDLLKAFFIETSAYTSTLTSIEVPKGRSLISGAIAVSKLPDTIYAVWIVDGGNWYGYSPDTAVRQKIKDKYRLISGVIPPYKAVIVWANEDSTIVLEDDKSIANVTQSYGRGFSIHGANNQNLGADEIVCNKDTITALFKVSGDIASVYSPSKVVDGMDNFYYIYSDEGYYVLCEQNLGGL